MLKKLNARKTLVGFGLVSAISTVMATILTPVMAFSDIQQFDEVGNAAQNVISSGQSMLVKIAMAAVPFSLIAILLLVIFSHNDKKISGLLGIAITILVAAVLILIVSADNFMEILKNIVGGFTGMLGGGGASNP